MTVTGKTIAITGAARGLGQELARHLAAQGAAIVAGDISDCAATIELVQSAGGKGIAVRLDVTDPASAHAMLAAGVSACGRLDGLLNNGALYGALHGCRFDAIAEVE